MHPTVKSSTIFASDLLTPDGALAVDSRLLELLFDQTPDIAFFIKDRAGRYAVVNQSLVERNGLASKSQLIGRRVSDIYPGDFGRIPLAQDEVVMRQGTPMLERLELHWQTPHRPCWCLTTKLPLRDASGNVTGLIGISRDVRAPTPLDDIPAGMTKALAWLETHYDEPLSPVVLARRSGITPARFARMVKRIFGIAPSQLITKVRIAAASRLLSESDTSVANIALDCGYVDHSAFTRAFRTTTGVTPSQFRQGAQRS
jgi:AraC-like DNA-binding protein